MAGKGNPEKIIGPRRKASRSIFTPVVIKFLLASSLSGITILFVLAIILYPGGYKLFHASISALGAPSRNPFPGWLAFSMACWIGGALLLMLVIGVYGLLACHSRSIALAYLLFNGVASVAFVVLGFFPEDDPTFAIHYVLASIIFGGFFVGAHFPWLLLVMGSKGGAGTALVEGRVIAAKVVVAVGLSMFWAVLAGVAATLFTGGFQLNYVDEFEWTFFWEWIYLFVLCVNTTITTLFVSSRG